MGYEKFPSMKKRRFHEDFVKKMQILKKRRELSGFYLSEKYNFLR
jgi:hypothetical protein